MDGNFITPPDHINFLAKKIAGNCGEIIDGSVAYLEANGGGPAEPHTHEHSHLFIVISGQARINMGNDFKILNPNESFLVNGNIPHSVWNNVDNTTIMVGMSIKENNGK